VSKSQNKKRILATATVISILFFFAVSAGSQAPVPSGQETVLTRARDLVAALYPEFSGKNFDLTLSASQRFDDPWRQILRVDLQVTRYGPPNNGHPAVGSDNHGYKVILPAEKYSMCSGYVVFNRHGWVHELGIGDSTDTHSEQNESLSKLVEAHPEWSEADEGRALKQAGARYGPEEKEEFVHNLRLSTLQPFFGTLKILSVEFQGWSEPHKDYSFDGFSWKVKAEAERPDGTKSPYSLYFEPFEGKLIIVFDGGLPLAPPID